MSDTPAVFISHTTSDQRDLQLAHDLAKGLSAKGAVVWIAPESIPVGTKWEPHIVSGIMEQCTHFLVIISAAAVRSEWVLKEIQLAQERFGNTPSFSILPLEMGRVGDYPSRDFINSFQKVAYYSELSSQLEAVAAAIGLRPAVPHSFSSLIAEKTEGFVGREFVFTAVDKFFAEHDSGYFIVEGDPGIGKSSILAEFVRRTDCVAHFNVLSQGINRASQFLESVSAQIIARYSLPYSSLPAVATQDGAFFARLLDEASAKLPRDERLAIAVDALDEVDMNSFPSGANILYLPPSLPRGVYVVMTRRAVTMPFVSTSDQALFNLMDYYAESREDVQAYIRRAAHQPQLRAWIDGRGLHVEDFVNILAEKSENNFMYLRYVLPEIERGLYEDLNIEQLPSGLEGYYDSHWRRMGMVTNPLPRTKLQIVYVLSEAPLPVSRTLIAQVVGVDEMTVQKVLNEWEQFLREQLVDDERSYSIYHTSFRDFLHRQDIVHAAGTTVKDSNSLISRNFMRELYPTE